jgi:Raf kinase inhibitor-like YbhB/YbcL family protein
MPFTLESSAFTANGEIPRVHTGEGDDKSPQLAWSGAPARTKTYALIMHDPDAPGRDFAHWVMFNIPINATQLPNDSPHRGDLSDGTVQGKNDFDRIGYGGPKPPPGKPHHYHFVLYALDAALPLESGADRRAVELAMQGHVLAQTELVGLYSNAS